VIFISADLSLGSLYSKSTSFTLGCSFETKLAVNYHFETSKIHFSNDEFKELKQKLAGLSKYDKLYMIGNTGGEDVQK